ncbi:HAMP domain-containing protein [Caldimonas thermodepolymerans]|uniref:histidine kinase n=1 Tax=Caldimonas thermodepolymerans TaxID=215580 RepID=A0A2S5T141_9BURK|nr:ATP-binding protein [Caldimonas thermodepolymerans]PPE68608.1 PAS domain-containing sensor histidine kinase [Caldimonas thermodepolymerans]QPC31990.1 HAMP domain-containing protein [Caldimonas thermodepolymerans]RDI01484.1 nitrogen fixation/metabolism regulation signal transduction histidine kinase [Caldimonas thermodepolymerans]TCP05068.1 nitrogen fixation/metabolism regulation signal transduction histidine kinase [Caldimonas thermodepolymerans]UZG44782.1 ATP-binding protein [Caldimonas th
MTKATRWAWIISLVAISGGGLVLVFLLALSTNNRRLYEQHFEWLLWVNVAVATVLALVIVIAGARLLLRLRRRKFGSRLLAKLAGIFALVGVIPGLVIYTVSYQFVTRSIESWFDVEVEAALDAGLNLGRVTLDTLVADLANKTRASAERLASEGRDAALALAIERIRDQLSAQDAALLGPNGQPIVSVGIRRETLALAPDRFTAAQLRQARSERVVAQIEGLDEDAGPPRVRALAHVPSSSFSLAEGDRYLLVTQLIPETLAANAQAVQAAYRDYQQRALAREGLRRMYVGTLTLSLFLAVFGAVLLAVTLGNQLARPLLLLAEGMRQVAQGDLTPKQVFASRDELGGLTRSFADMTQQLSDARSLVQRSLMELESAKTHLQTILDNMTAGVIVLDANDTIETVNPGATRILRLPVAAYRGRPLADVPNLQDFAAEVARLFELHIAGNEAGERDHWQQSFELQPAPDALPERGPITLLVRGAWLPQQARLLVFDDITEVVSAQRSIAWGEVARRLAHEIKNPLTPIQLSAERLQHKLEPKLEGPDRQMLAKAVATIVNQVGAMQQLVNEFRDYARLPSANLKPLDLNALVAEVIGLYGSAIEAGHLQAELAPGLPPILGDASQLRQVVHNLLQNGLDAIAEQPDGRVKVYTEAQRAEDGGWRAVHLVVADNGPGFPEKVLNRAFEPYVTTKSKGTGLGLAVVKKIVDEHGARIRIRNVGVQAAAASGAAVKGAQVSISFSKIAPPSPASVDGAAPVAAGPGS